MEDIIDKSQELQDLSPKPSPNVTTTLTGVENSFIREVKDTIPIEDDPTLPALTFRSLILGTFFAVISSIVAQIYFFRANTLSLSSFFVQLLAFPLGNFLAKLPSYKFRFAPFGYNLFSFDLNPGPFNVKEHVLVVVCASTTSYAAYAIDVISAQKLYYKQDLGIIADLLLLFTTQVIGYGMAGFLRGFLVKPAAMLWPGNLVQCALFYTLHKKEKKSESEEDLMGKVKDEKDAKEAVEEDGNEKEEKGFLNLDTNWTISRANFFILIFVATFIWQWFPSFIIPLISTMPILCWTDPSNRVLELLGSGMSGLGIGVLSLDWSVIATLGPLFTPFWATVNQIAGFVLSLWIITPISYFSNLWNAQLYPIVNAGIFDVYGNPYNIKKVLTPNFVLNATAYESYPLRMGTYFAISYGYSFLALTATITHIVLYYGKDIIGTLRRGSNAFRPDIHAKLMERYPDVPNYWYAILFVSCLLLSIFVCEYYPIYLPWWCVLLAIGLAVILVLPIGIIQAISNTQIGLNVLTEFVIGYIKPGYPIANIVFKTYGYMAMSQALSLVGDLKLGHYMKIPPRDMFNIQLYGTILGAVVNYAVMLWILATKGDLLLQGNSQWTARNSKIFFSASMIWGGVGPARMFGPDSPYHPLLYCFLVGIVAPIPFYVWGKMYPNSPFKFHLINVPIIALSMSFVPQNPANFIITGFIVAFVFQHYIYRYHHGWWKKYNYTLSAALDAGTATCLIILTIFQSVSDGFAFPAWYGNSDDPEQCFSHALNPDLPQ